MRRWLLVAAALLLAGCTVHLVTIQVRPSDDHRRDAGATQPTTKPASFMERVLEDLGK